MKPLMKSVVLLFVCVFSIAQAPQCSFAQETQNSKTDDTSKWFKGNLHTHSLWSDGNDFPEMIVKWYADRDYHFLALTDHNILSEGEKWFSIDQLAKRNAETAMEKYIAAFGDEWVETRTIDKTKKDADGEELQKIEQVRLRGLAEFRERFEKPERFLLMTGEEISDKCNGLPIHMNATNLKGLLRPAGGKSVRETINNNMRAAIEQAKNENREILVHLNHPNFGWAVTAEDLAFVTAERFFEVYNGHPSVNQNGDDTHPGIERMWDIANTIRIAQMKESPLFGLATDDGHKYHSKKGSIPGRGWIMVKASELTPNALIRSIQKGDFYASSGVGLEKVEFDVAKREIRIQIQPVEGETFETQFVGTRRGCDVTNTERKDEKGEPIRSSRIYSDDVGKVFKTETGLSPSYQLSGDELYVRAIVRSSKAPENPSYKGQLKSAWTQPVGWGSLNQR